jgi:membrane fusion protein (multidrug efflux system)
MADVIVHDEQEEFAPHDGAGYPCDVEYGEDEETGRTALEAVEHVPDRSNGQTPSRKPSRRPLAWLLASVLAAVAIAAGTTYYLYARVHESTDDAFIEGHIVPISSRVEGHVAKVYVEDNQLVKQGDLLVELDPRDFDVRLTALQSSLEAARAGRNTRTIGVSVTEITSSAGVEEARGALEAAHAAVEIARAAVATTESQQAEAKSQLTAVQAALAQAEAEVLAAAARRDHSRAHLTRVEPLVAEHAVSRETLDDATAAVQVADADFTAVQRRVAAQEAAVEQARSAIMAANSGRQQAEAVVAAKLADQRRAEAQLRSAQAAPKQVAQSQSQVDGATADAARAEADVKQAALKLSYTKIYAPAAGHVTRKDVEPGSYIQVGQPLLAVVEPNVWVVANFKETQLTEMRPGQPVTVNVDTYPGVDFKAHVDSVQRGSGSRFSLLPPENATGNYVKVVQRVPVKIVFDDPRQVAQYPLGPGMSVVPTVNIAAAGSRQSAVGSRQ